MRCSVTRYSQEVCHSKTGTIHSLHSNTDNMEKDSEPQPEEPQEEESQQKLEQSREPLQEKAQQQSQATPRCEPLQEESQQQSQTMPAPTKPQEMRPEECGICLHVYEELEHRPRMLPCGHTFCSRCLASLMSDGHLSCPTCRTNHTASDATHFPFNYDLENMMKRLGTQLAVTAPKATGETVEAISGKVKRRTVVAGLSRKLRSLIQEQKASMESVQETVQQELDQLGQYRAQLATSLAKHGHLLEELDKMAQQHRDARKLLEEEDLKVETFMEEGEEDLTEMNATKEQLDVVSTAQEAFAIIDSADHSTAVAEEWLQHSKEEFPSGTAYSTSCRVMENTEAALQVVAEEEDMPKSITSGHLSCSIMDVVQKIREASVEFMDLHTSSKFKKMVEAGKVFGTEKKDDGKSLFSKVTNDGDKLYLHSMNSQLPPPSSFTFTVREAMRHFPPTFVFLDLAWPRVESRRLHIRLNHDTLLTRRFVSLCLGLLGPTYCSTKFVKGENISSYVVVWGGDISGQTAETDHVVPLVQAELNDQCFFIDSGRVLVSTDLSDPIKSAQFGIAVQSCTLKFGMTHYYQLGQVESGLGVVEEAVRSNKISDMIVVDCGIVISQK